MTTICAHIVVKNEGNWIEYCLNSVVDYVDEMIIIDTGSIDGTRKKINKFIAEQNSKIPILYYKFENFKPENMRSARNEMLNKTASDWILVVDGDEVWFSEPLMNLKKAISISSQLKYVGFNFMNSVGGLSHWQDFSRENYSVLGITGSLVIKALKIKDQGLMVSGNYEKEGEGYINKHGEPINPSNGNTCMLGKGFIHLSNTSRSNLLFGDLLIRYRWKKYAADYDWIGTPILPEVFYKHHLNDGKNPILKSSMLFWILNKTWKLLRIFRHA